MEEIRNRDDFQLLDPTDGRVKIFSPDLKARYDSLVDGALPLAIKAGDYVSFIGKVGRVFVVELSGQ